MRLTCAFTAVLLTATASSAQSLYIVQGERAAEGSIGWSVGPFSNGIETHGAVSLDGRWDVGFGFNAYSADFGGPDDTTFTEWTPSVRYFLFKETDDATPVSLALHGQFVQSNFEADDEGWYVLAGAQVYKQLTLVDGFDLYPYLGFSFAGESYSLGGPDPERAVYLTRQFGVHATQRLTDRAWLRLTVEEHSFRRETYRAARAALIWRFP
jgi:hypothetical protein